MIPICIFLTELKMEKSLKFYLNIFSFMIFGCHNANEGKSDSNYNNEMAQIFLKKGQAATQGYPKSMNLIAHAIKLDSTYAEAYRELSIPYLKRGMPHLWKPLMDKAVFYDAKTWQGYRGYNYLWFYRDYKKAIADFNATDTLTPNFIDAPQGHNVDYWRGIAYLGLNDHEKSNWYFEKHIIKETEDFGEDYVDLTAFLFNGISYYETGNYEKALMNFDKQLKYSRNISADGKYYKAKVLKSQDKIAEAKALINSAIEDFNNGYYNNRAYVETLRQIYLEDLEAFKKELKQ